MRVYISGKITGLDLRVAREYFDMVEQKLTQAGHTAVNPMTIAPFNPNWEWHEYMIEDLRVLFTCDAIVLLDNWHDSKGAKIEHAIAKELNLKIYYPYHHKVLFD